MELEGKSDTPEVFLKLPTSDDLREDNKGFRLWEVFYDEVKEL